MKIIAAVDEKWGIGKGMNLLFRISEDMEFFKEKTMGKTVVMGRKTLESFPNAKPLKNRKNVVLTTDKNFKCDGTEIVHDIKTVIGKYGGDDTFVIGGGEVYRQLLPYCDSAYITKVFSDGNADVFIDDLDKNEVWELGNVSEKRVENSISFVFCTYINKNTQSHFEQKTL